MLASSLWTIDRDTPIAGLNCYAGYGAGQWQMILLNTTADECQAACHTYPFGAGTEHCACAVHRSDGNCYLHAGLPSSVEPGSDGCRLMECANQDWSRYSFVVYARRPRGGATCHDYCQSQPGPSRWVCSQAWENTDTDTCGREPSAPPAPPFGCDTLVGDDAVCECTPATNTSAPGALECGRHTCGAECAAATGCGWSSGNGDCRPFGLTDADEMTMGPGCQPSGTTRAPGLGTDTGATLPCTFTMAVDVAVGPRNLGEWGRWHPWESSGWMMSSVITLNSEFDSRSYLSMGLNFTCTVDPGPPSIPGRLESVPSPAFIRSMAPYQHGSHQWRAVQQQPVVVLNLDSNRIQTLHIDEVNQHSQLTKATFSRNGIATLDGSFNLTKLLDLSLARNALSVLPPDLFLRVPKLLRLDLGFNFLTVISGRPLNSLRKLAILNLGANRITSIDYGAFDGTTVLFSLSILNNRLQTLGRAFPRLGVGFGASWGDVHSRHWDEICHRPGAADRTEPSLWSFDASLNQITLVHRSAFEHCAQLGSIALGFNRITRLTANLFAPQVGRPGDADYRPQRLRNLELDSNPISSVESGLRLPEGLGILKMSTLCIDHIPAQLLRSSITEYMSTGNFITSISADVFRLMTRLVDLVRPSRPAPASHPATTLRYLWLTRFAYLRSRLLRCRGST